MMKVTPIMQLIAVKHLMTDVFFENGKTPRNSCRQGVAPRLTDCAQVHPAWLAAGLTCGGQASKVRLIWGLPPRLPVRLLMPEWPQGVSVMARGLPPARESAPMWLWGEHLRSGSRDNWEWPCGHRGGATQEGQVLSTLGR